MRIRIALHRLQWCFVALMIFSEQSFSFAGEGSFASYQDRALQENQIPLDEVVLWQFGNSDCQTCPVYFEPLTTQVKTKKVREFLAALSAEKFQLLYLYEYESDPQEYNLLAHMAVGILGRESSFFESWRYDVKENAQPMVRLVKAVRSYLSDGEWKASRNSRGPTQIKVVPGRVREYYGIDENDLSQPRAAAVATMGILIEALRELKQRALNRGWAYVLPQTYVDYLPYIYFGGTGRLVDGTATPETNIYVREMKRYMMFVRVHEGFPLEDFQFAP